MKGIKLLVALCLALADGICSAVSFDCGKPVSGMEKIICADPSLSAIDDELARQYDNSYRLRGDKGALRRDQLAWLKQRNACADSACVLAAYAARIARLREEEGGAIRRRQRCGVAVERNF